MTLSKIYKNKFVQSVSIMMVTILVAGGIANAATQCIPITGGSCTVKYWDYPFKIPGYWDIESEASVNCVGTKRVAIEHKLQKKNTLGVWINVKNSGYSYGTTAATAFIHLDCTNDKTTTWRSATTVVVNYGASSWSHSSSSAVYPCGT